MGADIFCYFAFVFRILINEKRIEGWRFQGGIYERF